MYRAYTILLILIYSITFAHSQNELSLVNAFPKLIFQFPVFLTHSFDGTNRIFVVNQPGNIAVFPNDSNISSVKIFLEVSGKITYGGERGLLGLAFHPSYKSNGFFYIYYTQTGTGNLIISRFKVSQDPDAADPGSEMILLNIPHSDYSNHNGGNLMFGRDGYLYMGTGDGGGGGDPFENGQNKNTLLAKMLRIDVNNTSPGKNYAIPPDNPFVNGGGSPEIFAWGFRNPWRFSQDSLTGIIYCGDVGQNKWEEIDIVQNGRNYGWNTMEAMHCYDPPTGCDTSGLTFPVKEYPIHTSSGECSITGGYVYRGNLRPELKGYYIYADYCSGKVWRFKYENGTISDDRFLLQAPKLISSFGVDQNNELYLVSHNNKIYKFSESPGGSNTIPLDFELKQNIPNPFNPETTIRYGITRTGFAQLDIYSANGEHVRALIKEVQRPDNYSVVWNGLNDNGELMPSGVYFYSLRLDTSLLARKMVLIR